MGAIRRVGSSPSEPEYLYQSHTIGRAASCELTLDRSVISGHHATLRWFDGSWTLRDLGSRNGTFVNGERLAGETGWPRELTEGDRIMFADEDEVWELIDAGEPRSRLIPRMAERPAIVLERDGLLALPSGRDPLAMIYLQGDSWQLELDGECVALEDGQELELGGSGYRVMLTDVLDPTAESASPLTERRVAELNLELLVTPDEESAAVVVRVGAETLELPERTYLYLLVFLARRRIADTPERGPLAGWVDVDTVCGELGLASPEALGLLVYRCRKAIAGCGVEDPAALIDRSRKRHLRVGVPAEHLSVSRLS